MGLLSCLMIPAGMLVAVLREEGSLWEVSLPLVFPTHGPAPGPPAGTEHICTSTLSRALQAFPANSLSYESCLG